LEKSADQKCDKKDGREFQYPKKKEDPYRGENLVGKLKVTGRKGPSFTQSGFRRKKGRERTVKHPLLEGEKRKMGARASLSYKERQRRKGVLLKI